MNEPFQVPELYIGCPVECSAGKSRAAHAYGLVIRVKSRSADILAFSAGQMGVFEDSWHEQDPRVEAAPPDAWSDNTRGTWKLTKGEIRSREMAVEMVTIRQKLQSLETDLAKAREAKPLEEDSVQPIIGRPRGRPRKLNPFPDQGQQPGPIAQGPVRIQTLPQLDHEPVLGYSK